MNPNLEFNSVLWATLDPTISVEAARLKLQLLTEGGFSSTGIKIGIGFEDICNLNTYINLIQTVVSIQQSEAYIPIELTDFNLIATYSNTLYAIKNALDPNHQAFPDTTFWLPFMDVKVDFLGLQLVTTMWSIINKPFWEMVDLKLQPHLN